MAVLTLPLKRVAALLRLVRTDPARAAILSPGPQPLQAVAGPRQSRGWYKARPEREASSRSHVTLDYEKAVGV